MATLAEAKTAYNTNATYTSTGSVVEAKAFQVACTQLLGFAADERRAGPDAVREDWRRYEKALERVDDWIAANDSSASTARGFVRHFGFASFRQ